MCSTGDSFDIEMEDKIAPKNYVCKDCQNKFKSVGKNIKCPSCKSANVEEAR